MSIRASLPQTKRWVIKIGSALLTNNGQGLDVDAIAGWVEQMASLQQQGLELVLVSSGAVAAGMTRLGWSERPDSIHELQAAAAVGQTRLVQAYEQEFQKFGLNTAQVLLDHDDLSSRQRYLNARSTLKALNRLHVIPVVNENDTVVTDEIRFGDNDSLAALVANLVEAEVLVILTDQDAMYTADPRSNPDARIITESPASDLSLDGKAGDGGKLGRGGMITKVRAARLASRSGAHTVIAGGRIENVLRRIYQGESVGTLLTADQPPQTARKRWLAGHLQVRGRITLDDGAVRVLKQQGKSLLPVGVRRVEGDFSRGDMVSCVNLEGIEVARGLINYSVQESRRIIGRPSEEIEARLGYVDELELIHRDNLVIL